MECSRKASFVLDKSVQRPDRLNRGLNYKMKICDDGFCSGLFFPPTSFIVSGFAVQRTLLSSRWSKPPLLPPPQKLSGTTTASNQRFSLAHVCPHSLSPQYVFVSLLSRDSVYDVLRRICTHLQVRGDGPRDLRIQLYPIYVICNSTC